MIGHFRFSTAAGACFHLCDDLFLHQRLFLNGMSYLVFMGK